MRKRGLCCRPVSVTWVDCIQTAEDIVKQRQRRRAPWHNADCRAIKAKTRRLKKIFRQKRTDDAKAAWRAQFSLQRSTFQRLHAEYWSAVTRGCPDSRTLWRKFDNSLIQPSTQTVIAMYFSTKIDAIRSTTATASPPVITARPVQPLLDFIEQLLTMK